MQLNDLKPAWEQFKLQNDLEDFNTTEILSLIETSEPSRPYQLLIKAVVFLIITFFCVGG